MINIWCLYKFMYITYQIPLYVQYIELPGVGRGRPAPSAENVSYGSS